MLIFTTDQRRLEKHFKKDPVLFAYHLGDLDDFYFPDCTWAATYGKSPRIDDLLLLYTGCDVPTLLAFGLTDKFEPLLSEATRLLPKKFYCHYQKQSDAILSGAFRKTDLGTHLKMKLVNFNKVEPKEDPAAIVRLGEPDEAALRELYGVAYPDNYFVPRMLQSGKYFGCRANTSDNRLVAVAGVHVDSAKYAVTVLGNVTTHPDYRGAGLAAMLTSHLVEELLSENKMVCLNVKADNSHAIRCYEKLGFERVHEYQEALFEQD